MSKNKKGKDPDKDEILFKVITLGDSGVGKTSIIKKFVSDKFDIKTISTIGFGSFNKELELKSGAKIKLNLIDTAGQENYQALSATYIKNADGVLFVFSHDNRTSFDNVKKWLENYKENNPNLDFSKKIPAFLVGNKSDLDHEIDDEEIEALKNENQFYGSINTSAKNGDNIQEAFENLGEMLIKIYGKRKKGQNVKLAAKHQKKNGGCHICEPDT